MPKRKKPSKRKPIQIFFVKTRKGYKVCSQSLRGIERSEEDLTLAGLFKFIVQTKLAPSR